MLHRSHNFIYHFLILFLAVLLVMFVMNYGLDHVKRKNPGMPLDIDHLFKVNLFIIDLCVLVIAETLLLLLFYRYTMTSMSAASILLVVFLVASNKEEARSAIVAALSPFVSNKNAVLDMADLLILLIVNTLLLSLLVTVLLKEVEREGLISEQPAASEKKSRVSDEHGGENGDDAYLPPRPS